MRIPPTAALIAIAAALAADMPLIQPNIRPAMELLKQMGFTRVQALHIPTNMAQDWFNYGYPAEPGQAAKMDGKAQARRAPPGELQE